MVLEPQIIILEWLSRKNNKDIKEISIVMFLSYGISWHVEAYTAASHLPFPLCGVIVARCEPLHSTRVSICRPLLGGLISCSATGSYFGLPDWGALCHCWICIYASLIGLFYLCFSHWSALFVDVWPAVFLCLFGVLC